MTRAERILLILFLVGVSAVSTGRKDWWIIAAFGGSGLGIYYLLAFPFLHRKTYWRQTVTTGILLALTVAAVFAQGLDYSGLAYEVIIMAIADAAAIGLFYLAGRRYKPALAIIHRLTAAIAVCLLQSLLVAINSLAGFQQPFQHL